MLPFTPTTLVNIPFKSFLAYILSLVVMWWRLGFITPVIQTVARCILFLFLIDVRVFYWGKK